MEPSKFNKFIVHIYVTDHYQHFVNDDTLGFRQKLGTLNCFFFI